MEGKEDRWEQGSHFHHVDGFLGEAPLPWQGARFYYSGSPALNDLLDFLSPTRSACVWLPSYYCGEVLRPWLAAGHPCRYYDGNPLTGFDIPHSEIRSGDVFISNCYFGVDILPTAEIERVREAGATVVEDHSQDPYSSLALGSSADYVAASLRKSLPLPDGGVLWSPTGRPLPETPLPVPLVFAPRLGGMLAKRLYLQGEFDHKEVFLDWFSSSEQDFAGGELRGMSAYSFGVLRNFDAATWRHRRAENFRVLRDAIRHSEIEMLHRTSGGDSPMGLVMLLPTHHDRDALRSHLISQRIYPVVYWPHIPEIPAEHAVQARDFVDRMLFLHTDARYSTGDMERVASIINAAPQ